MALEPATMDPLEGPFNLDELRMWVSDTRKIASGKSFQVVRLGDLFDELLFGNAEKFEPLVGNILDANKQYRFRADLTDDLSISVINLPNGKMIMGVINPVKKDAKFLINGHPVVIDAVKPTMVIGLQYKDDKDNTGRGLFIVSQASDTIEPPKILTEPQGGTFIEGDVADVIATAIGYKDVIAIKNGDVLDGIKAAALPVPILSDTADIYVFGFVHPKDPNMITWTKPASIKRGEAEPAQITSQSQSLSADAGTEVTLDMEAIGTPPPVCYWIKQVNGVDGPKIAGKQIKVTALYTETYVPVVVNRYKVNAQDKFDPTGILKEFPDRGDKVTITPDKQDKAGPSVIMDDATVQSTLNVNPLPGDNNEAFEGTLDVTAQNPAVVSLVNFKLLIGDVNLPANTAGVRYKETLTHNASPWATNPLAFEGSLISAPTNLIFTAENPANKSTGLIQWTKSVDTLSQSTQEYSLNYSGARTWTDISDNKLSIKDNVPSGDFAVREKARTGKPASAALVNNQAFVTALNSNYVFTTSGSLQTLAGYKNVFLDTVNDFNVTRDYNRIIIPDDPRIPTGFYRIIQMNDSFEHVYIQMGIQNDQQSLFVADEFTGAKYRVLHGKPNAAGNGGTALTSFLTGSQVFDPDSPGTAVQNGDVITIQKAYNGFGNTPLEYTVTEVIEDYQGMRLMKLIPLGHSTQIGSSLVGGIWNKKN